jgi:hypothetical protein
MAHEAPQFPEGKKISAGLDVIEESALGLIKIVGDQVKGVSIKNDLPLSRWDLEDRICIDTNLDRDENWESIRAQRKAFENAFTRYSMLFRSVPKPPSSETQKWVDEELGLIAYTTIIRHDFMLAIADIIYVDEPEAGIFVPKQSRPQLWVGNTAKVNSFLDEHPYVPAKKED